MDDDALGPSLVMDLRREVGCASYYEHDYLGQYEGALRDVDSEDEGGKVRMFVVDVEGARNAGIAAFDLLDFDAATAPYIELISRRVAGNFSRAVTTLLGGEDMVYSNNMLIIDRIELLPKYRGYGLGLKCMEACLRHFRHGCRIAAIKPYPLQFEGGAKDSDNWSAGLELSSLTRNQRTSTQKLRRHYAQLGFRHVRGTDLMIRDLYE